MKKEIKNISFKNGIVENYKQDYFTQQEQLEYMLTSVLYMENYNPNIEYHSLILRPGLDPLLNADGFLLTDNYSNYKGNSFSDVLFTYNHLKALLVQHYARMNYVDSETNYNKLDALFLSYKLDQNDLPPYHQYGNNMWVTNINFNAVNPALTPASEQWQLSYNPTTSASRNTSFVPLGKFRDMVRNGSRFLFVTEPTDDLYGNTNLNNITTRSKRLYFPVYTFEQVKDPRKRFIKAYKEKTYDYLNGLKPSRYDSNGNEIPYPDNSLGDLDDAFWQQVALRKFRIKYPAPIFKDSDAITTSIKSQKTLTKNLSHIKRLILEKDPAYDMLQLEPAFKEAWYDYMFKGYSQGDTKFPLDVQERIILPTYFTKTGEDTSIPRIELLVWEQPLLWDTQNSYSGSTVNLSFLNLKTTKKMGYSLFGNDCQDTWSRLPMIDQEYKVSNKSTVPNRSYKNPYLDTFLKPNHHELNSFLRNNTNTTWKDTSLTLNNETYKFWQIGNSYRSVDSSVAKSVYHAARFVAHDYIKVELPRAWMSGDEIPFLVTTTLNGQEVVLLKETYVVGRDIKNDLVVNRTIGATNSLGEGTNYNVSHVLFDHLDDTNPSRDEATDVNDTDAVWYNVNYLVDTTRTRSQYANSIELTKVNGTQENEIGIAPIDSLTLYDNYGDGNTAVPGRFTTDLSGYHNTIQFTIRLNKEALAILLAQGSSNIKVYASRPNNDEKLFDKVGSSSLTDAPPIYAKPLITENSDDRIIEGTKYGLLKTFLIEGPSDIIQDYTNVKRSNYRTNAWRLDKDLNNKEWIYAVPVNEGDRVAGLSSLIAQNALNLPSFEFESVTDLNTNSANNEFAQPYYNNFTPDFFLWDYPSDTESYIIGDSGQYWEGTGARCITSVKGRTFIGGTFDKDFTEEQGLVRWSSLNNGSHITDLFVEEASIQVGHLPITALLEYREQLWVFNKDNYYRIMLNEIGNVNSWEFVDSKFGQGTYSPKTLTKTPYGVCFASEGGIYLSDGTNPINLVDNPEQVLSIKSLYQHLMLGNTYQYSQINNPGEVFIEPGKDYNIYAELYYESEPDELILVTPIKKESDGTFEYDETYYNLENHLSNTHWYKLIYSFANKNWRTEVGNYYVNPETLAAAENGNDITYGEYGRMWEDDRVARTRIKFQESGAFDPTRIVSDNNAMFTTIHSPNINMDWDNILNLEKNKITQYIYGRLSTHEIGNGEDDHILNKAILECTPKENATDNSVNWLQYTYGNQVGQQLDPVFTYELRNRTFVNQTRVFNNVDLINLNMNAKGGANPFRSILTTPTNDTVNYTIDASETEVGRESLNMIAPMDKFRRTRFSLLSKVIAKVRSITVSYKVFNRRNY